jgi:hypothetical protein
MPLQEKSGTNENAVQEILNCLSRPTVVPYSLTCRTVAGEKPLNVVADA